MRSEVEEFLRSSEAFGAAQGRAGEGDEEGVASSTKEGERKGEKRKRKRKGMRVHKAGGRVDTGLGECEDRA